MNFLGSDELKKLLKFAVDTDGQTSGDRLTLTIMSVVQITGEGRIAPDSVRVGHHDQLGGVHGRGHFASHIICIDVVNRIIFT